MSITTAQALTKMINGIEEADKETREGFQQSKELMKMMSNDYPNLKKLDNWEASLCAVMFEIAVVNGLSQTKKVKENFKAMDKGMALLSSMVLQVSEDDMEIATNLANQTLNIQRTFIQASVTSVLSQQGEKASKKLADFLEARSESTKKSMTKIMEENTIKGFKN